MSSCPFLQSLRCFLQFSHQLQQADGEEIRSRTWRHELVLFVRCGESRHALLRRVPWLRLWVPLRSVVLRGMQGFFQEEYPRYELFSLWMFTIFALTSSVKIHFFFFFKDTMTTSAPPQTSALSTRTDVKAARPVVYANAMKWEWWSVVSTSLVFFFLPPYLKRHLIIRVFWGFVMLQLYKGSSTESENLKSERKKENAQVLNHLKAQFVKSILFWECSTVVAFMEFL